MRFILIVIAILFAASPTLAASVKTVQDLDLKRYLGTWHEVARYPLFFQKGCKQSKATYKLIGPKKISVHNRCIKNGKKTEVMGDAIVKGPGKLAVKFSVFMPFRAPYWVLWVDPNYEVAVVGGPKRKNGWILARSPNPSKKQLAPALKALTDNGYKLNGLIWDK
ncbi:MAG: lipocalin family protein [Hyphomicrobiales bacterium]